MCFWALMKSLLKVDLTVYDYKFENASKEELSLKINYLDSLKQQREG